MASVRRDMLVITVIIIIGLLVAMPFLTLTGKVRTVPFTMAIVASFAAIVFAWRVARTYGSMVSVAMTYMMIGATFLLAIEAVMLAYFIGGVTTTDALRTWNNIMFAGALVLFVTGVHRLTARPTPEKRLSWKNRIGIGISLLLFLALILKREECFVVSSAFMAELTRVHVFNAVGAILAAYIALRTLQLHRHLGKTVTASVNAFIAAWLFLAGMQVWVITSRLISLSDDIRTSGAAILVTFAMLALVEAFRRMTAAVAVDSRGP